MAEEFRSWTSTFARPASGFTPLSADAPPADAPPASRAPPRPAAAPRPARPASSLDVPERPAIAPAPPEADPLAALKAEVADKEAKRAVEHAAATKALREAEAKAKAQAERLEAAAKAVEATRQGLREEFREGAARVILEACRRIAGDALRVDPGLLVALVDEAADALGRGGLRVRVSPEDAATLRERLADAGLDVVEDFAVSGGVVVEGPAGRIDASVDSALESVAAVLDQWRAGP